MDKQTVVEIADVVQEAPTVRTLYFKHKLDAKPGQFVMLWIPGLDAKPFGVSGLTEDGFSVTVCKVGPFSSKVHELKQGDKVGIFGPYGTHFDIGGAKRIVTVAGGYGAAPLAFLADEALAKGARVEFMLGGRTKDNLIFEERMKDAGANVHACTDDGSYGTRCFVTALLEEFLKKEKPDKVFAVGPELMMKTVVGMCKDIPCELSLERYVKCGFGVCGQCVVDPLGIRMCKEGPVLSKETVAKVTEFGRYHRDGTGAKVEFK